MSFMALVIEQFPYRGTVARDEPGMQFVPPHLMSKLDQENQDQEYPGQEQTDRQGESVFRITQHVPLK